MLWFQNKTEEAVDYYISLFDHSSIKQVTRYTDAGNERHGIEPGSVMTIDFELCGESFTALNGGNRDSFSAAVSFYVTCSDMDTLTRLWRGLTEGGRILMPMQRYDWNEHYGWCQDKYGVSWQISLGKKEDTGQWITPCIMFTGPHHGKAADAIHHYTSIFRNSSIEGILRYQNEAPEPDGSVKHAQFTLEGSTMMTMESAQSEHFPLNASISFVIRCENQEETDYYWDRLTEGADPKYQQCG